MPGVFDCLSGLLVEKVGFKAAYLSGAGLSVSVLGRPDIGLLTLDEVVHMTRRITRVLHIPIIVDADTGAPITTEALKYGQRVSVIAASVPPIMRSEAALAVFGPRAFGYDYDFIPIEQLLKA